MNTIADIYKSVISGQLKTIAIAGISLEEIMLVREVLKEGYARFILIDEKNLVENLLKEYGVESGAVEVVPVDSVSQAPAKAMELIKQHRADLPMKGQVHTAAFLKAVLSKEGGLSTGRRLSQITMFDGYNGDLQFLTDCAIHISPTLQEKVEIIHNAVEAASMFLEEQPRVALLGAVETISEKMPDTLDSAVITQMNRRGQIKGCVIDGPLSLDNAISEEFAKIKKIDSPVAGRANILVSSDLREANNVSKAIIHYAKREACSIIAGTSIPIIMTSRTDLQRNKMNTIAVACYMLDRQK